jgi:hypothetical protein
MKRNDNPLRSAAERGVKSTLLGISVNLGLALIKCFVGLLGDSFAWLPMVWNPSWMSSVVWSFISA